MCCKLVGGSAGFAGGSDKLQAVLFIMLRTSWEKEVLLMLVQYYVLVARYFLGVLDKEKIMNNNSNIV